MRVVDGNRSAVHPRIAKACQSVMMMHGNGTRTLKRLLVFKSNAGEHIYFFKESRNQGIKEVFTNPPSVLILPP